MKTILVLMDTLNRRYLKTYKVQFTRDYTG